MSDPPIEPPPDPTPDPITELQVQNSDGLIVAYGQFPGGSPHPEITIVPLYSHTEADKLKQPGDKFYDSNTGIITVTAPPPVPPITSTTFPLTGKITTTDATAQTLISYAIPLQTAFDISFVVHAIDRGNGAVKKWRRETFIKRLNAAPSVIGGVQNPLGTDPADTAAAAWTTAPSISGNNMVLTVTGAAGRTIDWMLFANVRQFTPGGI